MVVLQFPNPRPNSCLLQSSTNVNGCSPVPHPKAQLLFVTKLYLCEWLFSSPPNPRPQSCLLQSSANVNGCSPVPQPKAQLLFVTKLYLCEWLFSPVSRPKAPVLFVTKLYLCEWLFSCPPTQGPSPVCYKALLM
ncbi:hypothetical protein DPMN_083236 [Dreissena polymorpha]|uniref:Uncharacterized protein n=1 Tax=Dreissena polymorpha TaxID=45954 RepID=A0A9D3YC96_DREPO|nr:hypothetical protein DPMN_083236 [Dreissena polymorpha]